ALDAVARPRHGFQTFCVDLAPTVNALAEAALANATERAFYHPEQLPVVVALCEQEFLRIRVCSAVGDVLCSLCIRGTAIFLSTRNYAAQLLLSLLELFLELFEPLLFHSCLHFPAHLTTKVENT